MAKKKAKVKDSKKKADSADNGPKPASISVVAARQEEFMQRRYHRYTGCGGGRRVNRQEAGDEY